MHDVAGAIGSLWVIVPNSGKVSGPAPKDAAAILDDGCFTFEKATTKVSRRCSVSLWDEILQEHTLYLWDPLIQSAEHPNKCPAEYLDPSGTLLKCDGTLHSNGYCPTPKHIKGVGTADEFVMTRRWECQNKTHVVHVNWKQRRNFLDTDPEMLELLPVSERLKCRLSYTTARTGLTPASSVLVDVLGGIPGLATDQAISVLNDLGHRGRAGVQLQHFELAKVVQRMNRGTMKPLQVPAAPTVLLVSAPHNGSYMRTAVAVMHAPQEDYSNRLMASGVGRILAIDAGIKNTSKVRVHPSRAGSGSVKAADAIHTMLNENKQVIAQYCGSNSPYELLPGFMDVRRRFERHAERKAGSLLLQSAAAARAAASMPGAPAAATHMAASGGLAPPTTPAAVADAAGAAATDAPAATAPFDPEVRAAPSCNAATSEAAGTSGLGVGSGSSAANRKASLVYDVGDFQDKLGQIIYTDDPNLYGGAFKLAFGGRLGVGLRDGDEGIKQDLYHGLDRIDQVLLPGHSLKTSAMSLLCNVILVVRDEDVLEWQEAGGAAKYPKRDKHCRFDIPAPDILLLRLEAWEKLHRNAPCNQVGGKQLFMKEAPAALDRMKEAIKAWRYSDAEELVNGVWQKVPLHINKQRDPKKLPKYQCCRGTNKCDNYFRHFHLILAGCNNSVETATRLFGLHNLRWNLKRAAAIKGIKDMGCYDLPLLVNINKAAQALGLPCCFPDIADLPPTEEMFGSDYASHRLLAGCGDLSRESQQALIIAASSKLPGAPKAWSPALAPVAPLPTVGITAADAAEAAYMDRLALDLMKLMPSTDVVIQDFIRSKPGFDAAWLRLCSPAAAGAGGTAAAMPASSLAEPRPLPLSGHFNQDAAPMAPAQAPLSEEGGAPAESSYLRDLLLGRGAATRTPGLDPTASHSSPFSFAPPRPPLPSDQQQSSAAHTGSQALPVIDLGDTRRLKRPLSSKVRVAKGAEREVKPGQRKGFFRRQEVGSQRASLIKSSGPINSLFELNLFNQLLPLHTSGWKTNFDMMARDFNNEVVQALRRPQESGSQGNALTIKTARQLKQWDRMMAKELARRDAAGMMEAIAGVPMQSVGMSIDARDMVSIIQALVTSRTGTNFAPSQQSMQQVVAGGAGAAAQPPPMAAGAHTAGGVNKATRAPCTGQGSGKKGGCTPCGWRADGVMPLGVHRAGCALYQKWLETDGAAAKRARLAEGEK